MEHVYLAKSNKADPNKVGLIRALLQTKYIVHEYVGGTYNPNDLSVCDKVIMVLEPGTLKIGKGVYHQLNLCRNKGIPALIIYTPTTTSGFRYDFLSPDSIIETYVTNPGDYINFGVLDKFTFNRFFDIKAELLGIIKAWKPIKSTHPSENSSTEPKIDLDYDEVEKRIVKNLTELAEKSYTNLALTGRIPSKYIKGEMEFKYSLMIIPS